MGRCKGSCWIGNTRIPNPAIQEYFAFMKEVNSIPEWEKKQIIKNLESKEKLNQEEKEILSLLKEGEKE